MGFGESDDIADGIAFRHQHDHAVQAESQTAVGRSTVFEGFYEPAEFFPDIFIAEIQKLEDLLLNFGVVNTDGTAAQFHAVQDHIVCFGADFFGLIFQKRDIFILGHGKGMVHRHIALFFFAVFEHREINDPEEGNFIVIQKAFAAGDFQTEVPQNIAGGEPFIGDKEQSVTGFGVHGL